MYYIIQCIVQGKQARVKTQICVTRPQCVKYVLWEKPVPMSLCPIINRIWTVPGTNLGFRGQSPAGAMARPSKEMD